MDKLTDIKHITQELELGVEDIKNITDLAIKQFLELTSLSCGCINYDTMRQMSTLLELNKQLILSQQKRICELWRLVVPKKPPTVTVIASR